MRRKLVQGLLLSIFMIAQITSGSSAEKAKPADWETATIQIGSKKVSYQVLRLGPAKPEESALTLLRLPKIVYKELKKNPEKFINEQRLFTSRASLSDQCTLPEPSGPDDSMWIVTTDHKACHSSCSAFREWRE